MRRLFLVALAVMCVACTAALPPKLAPAPTVAPKSTAASPATALPSINISPYRAAMKPEFAADVDRFAAAPRYQIDLTIAPDLKSYSATQVVTYTNAETVTLNEVYFRLFPNSDTYGGELKVSALRAAGVAVTPTYELNHTAMKVALAQPLPPGAAVVFEMDYAAQVPTQEVKIGYNRYGLHDNVLTLPGFFPMIPVYDDEGWNVEVAPPQGDTVFTDSALFQVNITAPSDQVVVASGVCEVTPASANKTWRCVSGPMRDFMIAMSSDFVVKSEAVDGVKINSYARKADEQGGEQTLRAAVASLRSYDRRFGAYPFNEFDVVGTPTTAGGIEYPGLVVIADSLYQGDNPALGVVVAHETAHQWWYSLVGNDQIDEPFMDEALAEFSPALVFRDQYGALGMRTLVQYWQASYDQVKGKPDDKRADLPVGAYSESQYGAIVYDKVALFYNALYELLGDEKFNQFLQEYFQTYRYGVAYPQDLFAIAAKYAGQAKLDDLRKAWITTP